MPSFSKEFITSISEMMAHRPLSESLGFNPTEDNIKKLRKNIVYFLAQERRNIEDAKQSIEYAEDSIARLENNLKELDELIREIQNEDSISNR